VRIPQHEELAWPALKATRDLGGSATVREMYERVVADECFSEELQAVPHGDGRLSELDYRLHWARTQLKAIGALINSSRGVWAITERGLEIGPDDVKLEVRAWRAGLRERRRSDRGETIGNTPGMTSTEVPADIEDDDEDIAGWKEQLLAELLKVSPAGFERLSQRLLREAGFVNVTVTGKSGDGGI
jgi:restriction system protein